MDATIAAQPSALYTWIATNGQIVYFFAQVGFWVLMIVLLAYAVAQYKRWVNFQLGTGHSGKLRTDLDAVDTDVAAVEVEDKPKREPIKVEEFVE